MMVMDGLSAAGGGGAAGGSLPSTSNSSLVTSGEKVTTGAAGILGGASAPITTCSGSWGSTNLASKPEECSSSTEREARSVALEKAYVHDVYQQIACHFSDSRYRAWPRVKQFLLDLEPGSFVCDVGKPERTTEQSLIFELES